MVPIPYSLLLLKWLWWLYYFFLFKHFEKQDLLSLYANIAWICFFRAKTYSVFKKNYVFPPINCNLFHACRRSKNIHTPIGGPFSVHPIAAQCWQRGRGKKVENVPEKNYFSWTPCIFIQTVHFQSCILFTPLLQLQKK